MYFNTQQKITPKKLIENPDSSLTSNITFLKKIKNYKTFLGSMLNKIFMEREVI